MHGALPISPAIDFGDYVGLPSTDQRGYVRPYGDGPDMGAVEYGSVPAMQQVQPTLNITSTTTNFQVSFTSTISGSYYLQMSTNLVTWTDLSTNPISGTTNVTQAVSKLAFKNCYFRLIVQ